jgi:hypothetical protein
MVCAFAAATIGLGPLEPGIHIVNGLPKCETIRRFVVIVKAAPDGTVTQSAFEIR